MIKYKLFFLIFAVALFYSCTQTEYERLLNEQLASGVRNDSLFLGLHFDMTKKDFYSSCWEMNKQGRIIQGPGNLSVQYQLDSTELKAAAYMRFYPQFKNDLIHVMPVEFTYVAWAPWNQQLSADSLLLDVKNMFEQWYGGKFILLEDESKNIQLWVKIDGNRRIRLYVKNISTVKAEFVNLLEIDL
jgi:hypothetical protein